MIAIKDMEMPKCCVECPYFDDYCALTGKWESDTEQIRDNDCPLVEIVTCKDCKYNGTMYCKCFMCDGNEYMSYHNPNFFCADGERREQDESVD